jgi:co-chaperonin GroES (HSP10)/predicted RNA-binding Zn-ribbon protein involved in translation (DUF1610 family)
MKCTQEVCSECGNDIIKSKNKKRRFKWEPVNKRLDSEVEQVPFYCNTCGSVHINLKALHNYVFIYPIKKKSKSISSVLIVPEVDEPEYTDYGIVLTYGKGYYDNKRYHPVSDLKVGMKVVYDKTVPWGIEWQGTDGKKYLIKIMPYLDVKLVPKE